MKSQPEPVTEIPSAYGHDSNIHAGSLYELFEINTIPYNPIVNRTNEETAVSTLIIFLKCKETLFSKTNNVTGNWQTLLLVSLDP